MIRSFLQQFIRRRARAHERRYKTLNTVCLNRAATLHNVALIQAQHPDSSIIPVLKSNAYGHGLWEMASILNGAACSFLAVDGYFEAAKIRYITNHKILVLGYVAPENVHLVDVKHCSFVVQDTAGLEAFGKLGRRVRVHVELNTGMNRLGLNEGELDDYLRTLKRFSNLELEGVMSHLADADNPVDDTLTQWQVSLFNRLVKRVVDNGFQPKYIHIAQTAGSTKVHSSYANAIRLGIGLYGVSPLDRADKRAKQLAGLQPVLSLQSTVIKTIDLQPGEVVGYNGTFVAKKPTRIGVLPIGYYEGVPRALSNVGVVTAGGVKLSIVGRVSMNHTMIDLGRSRLDVGDVVTVISDDPAQPNSVAGMSAWHTLFPYTTVTAIASSIRREII